MEDLVSIIILCFNHEKYVRDCLKSIVNQTYSKFEVIIIDNHSEDKSVDIIETYLPELRNKATKVIFIKNDRNLGIPKAMNQGLKLARGKYIKELASDDFLEVNGIEILVKALRKSQASVIVGNGYLMDEEFRWEDKDKQGELSTVYERKPDFVDSYFERLIQRNNILAPAAFIDANMFTKYGEHNEELPFEDWEFWIRIVGNGEKVSYVDMPVVYYRRSSSSITYINKYDSAKEQKVLKYYDNNIKLLELYGHILNNKKMNDIEKSICKKYLDMAINADCADAAHKIFKNILAKKLTWDFKIFLKYILYRLKII